MVLEHEVFCSSKIKYFSMVLNKYICIYMYVHDKNSPICLNGNKPICNSSLRHWFKFRSNCIKEMYILFCANDYMTDSFVQELIFAQLVRTEPFSFGMLAVAHIFSPTYFRIFFRPWLQHKNLDWTVEHFLGHILCILYIILICSYMTGNCYKYLVKS